jgi:hypothetical protein
VLETGERQMDHASKADFLVALLMHELTTDDLIAWANWLRPPQ